MSNTGLRPGQKIKMTSYDELCGGTGEDTAIEVAVSELHDFPNHPFKVRDDEQMQELVKSISLRGILNPLIVRKDPLGGYQIISGHRRRFAAQKLDVKKVPVSVIDVDDDQAVIMMVDSNIQRENITPGEKALAMKQKYESLIHKGEASDKWSNDEIGEMYGMSGRQVQRYLRLNELIPELLNEVDSKRIQLMLAVDISFLSKQVQMWLFNAHLNGMKIKPEHIKVLRTLDENEALSEEDVFDVLDAGNKIKGREITLSDSKINYYFSDDYSSKDIKEIIYQLLKNWKDSMEGEQG